MLENGINIKIFGSNWNIHELFNYTYDIKPKNGEEYFSTIAHSKICLAFLSKLNRDDYTRRNFEIPATGSLMLSERTEELTSFFKENEEAVFFSSKEEALEKIIWMLNNEKESEIIALKGRYRAFQSGYDIDSRVKHLIYQINGKAE